METLLTLALIGLMASFAYPLLRGGPPDPILSACLTLALSFGLLSAALLLAYWLQLSAPIIGLGIMLSGALAGASLQRRVGPRPPAQPARTFTRPTRLQGTAWLAIAIIVAAILFNAGYWGLLYDDAISIYGWYGKQIALSGRLPALGPESLYEAYPMLVPLLYAFVQQTTGVFNSPLLALIPALCGVGAIGVAYLLGREIYNRDCGLIAALLIALAPPVSRWASAGYVDLPTGFFYGLAALCLWRAAQQPRYSLLAGLLIGFAAFGKNSGLLILPSVGLWFGYRWLGLGQPLPALLKQSLLLAIGFLPTAGFWYARNWLEAGFIVPPTGWTWLAERNLTNLAPYLTDTRYLPVGLVFTLGIAFGLANLLRASTRLQALFLLLMYGPFFVIWWALFSYDDRFLLAVMPFVAVLAAVAILAIGQWASKQAFFTTFVQKFSHVFIIILLLPSLSAALLHKEALIRPPFVFMDIETRRQLALGVRYQVANHLRTLAPARLWTGDNLLPYFCDGLQVTVGNLPSLAQIAGYDYLLLQPADPLPSWLKSEVAIYEQAGYRLYAVGNLSQP
jgi:hypothetical protein